MRAEDTEEGEVNAPVAVRACMALGTALGYFLLALCLGAGISVFLASAVLLIATV